MEKDGMKDLLFENLKAEESLLQWFRENPISLTMVFMMVYLVESEIVDQETARGYMREITLRADELQEK